MATRGLGKSCTSDGTCPRSLPSRSYLTPACVANSSPGVRKRRNRRTHSIGTGVRIRSESALNLGDDHDTPAFTVASIARWWQRMGAARYPDGTRLTSTADAGDSNSYRSRVWKVELAKLAASFEVVVTVCYMPPGTSKWNKIEHRLFVSMDLAGQTTHDRSSHRRAHRRHRRPDRARSRSRSRLRSPPPKQKVTNAELATVPFTGHNWHPDWNYTIAQFTPSPGAACRERAHTRRGREPIAVPGSRSISQSLRPSHSRSAPVVRS